jgi:Translation machinery-associated protein 16
MAPTKKPQKNAKKEKIFHPESRKASQLARKQLRKSKLAEQASKRAKLHSAKGKSRRRRRLSSRPFQFLFKVKMT